MKPVFELTNQTATLHSFNPRIEKHGDEDMPAADLRLSYQCANDELSMFGPQLRDSLYWRDTSGTSIEQKDLEGLGLTDKPNLRNPFLASPIKLGQQRDLVGAIVEIQYGIDSLIRFDAAKVNNYRLDPQEGGTVTISFRVQVSGIKDIDAGRLCGLIGHEVTISVDPPTATDPIHEDEQMAGAY